MTRSGCQLARRIANALAGSTLLAAALALPAAAHITAHPDAGAAGEHFEARFRVPHGCDGSPTIALRIKLPDGAAAVKAQMKPGWKASVKLRAEGRATAGEHDGANSRAVDEVEWSGGVLPDSLYDDFGLTFKLPAVPGTLYFPVVQQCEQGVRRWIEVPAKGERWGDLRTPAPFVRVLPR